MVMKFNFKPIKWMAAYLSYLTMILTPVAMGKEAESLNKNNLQQIIKEFGLDKKTTVGDFWGKSKGHLPDSMVALNANLANCPKCPNGSFKTKSGCPSEGGSGNNTCPYPPYSGGLPGIGK